MKNLFFIALLTLSFTGVQAQKVVALHSANGTQMFSGQNPFVDAHEAAMDGDTIYLPGGVFTAPTLFSKSLTVIGAGYHPDSTQATGFTSVSNHFVLNSGSDNSYFEGIRFLQDFRGGTVNFVNDTIVNITLRRCMIDGIFNVTYHYVGNMVASESIFKNWLYLSKLHNSAFHNCVFEQRLDRPIGLNIENCIFMWQSSSMGSNHGIIRAGTNSTYKNNIFLDSLGHVATTHQSGVHNMGETVNNVFINNLFVHHQPRLASVSPYTLYVGLNNYFNIPLNDIFVNQSGFTYSFSDNYNLANPANFLGDEGTQVGVHGGLFPLKAGGIPTNPRIIMKSIAPQTTTGGQLPVEFTVGSQSN